MIRSFIAEAAAGYLLFMPEVRVLRFIDKGDHHEISVRAQDRRTAERHIDEALELAVHRNDQSKVYRGAELFSGPTLSQRELPEVERWTYNVIITDRRFRS